MLSQSNGMTLSAVEFESGPKDNTSRVKVDFVSQLTGEKIMQDQEEAQDEVHLC